MHDKKEQLKELPDAFLILVKDDRFAGSEISNEEKIDTVRQMFSDGTYCDGFCELLNVGTLGIESAMKLVKAAS